MLEKDCIFCKIIKGDIKNYTVYEDDHSLAFLDINPHAKGHTVVIPKKHAENVFDLDDGKLGLLSVATKKAMKKINTAFKPDGYNVGWNHGDAGGQVVNHLHIHILPRYIDDGGGNMHSIVNSPGDKSVEEVFKKLKSV